MWGSPKFLDVHGFALILILDSGWLGPWDWGQRWYLKVFGIELTLVVSPWWGWGSRRINAGPVGSEKNPNCCSITFQVIVL